VILVTIWWLQAAHKFDVKRFNLKKLSDLQVRKPYQIEILNRSATLENLNARVDKMGFGKTLKGISRPQVMRVCLSELKQHKLWFD